MVFFDAARSDGEHINEVINTKGVEENPYQEETYHQRLSGTLRDNLSALGAQVTNRQLESLAVLIHESMSASGRIFHSIEHVFDISEGADEIVTLSALFHDVIYYNVDGGLSPKQAEILEGVILKEDKGGTHVVIGVIDPDADPLLAMVAELFGISSEQTLSPFGGQNEFLSAVVAVRALEEILRPDQLAQIAACIEGTVPFRPVDSEGKGPPDILYERLSASNEKFNLAMTEDEIVDTVHRSVDLSNRDIGNFASSDTGYFLDQTWKLLPESNASLRRKFLYTLYDYQIALVKLEGFFSNLDSNIVFREFQNKPNKEKLQNLKNQAAYNINIGCGYVRAKLLAISTLAAMATLTGGDAPVSLFMGDFPSKYHHSVQLGDSLPSSDLLQGDFFEEKIYKLLDEGRKSDSTFDVRNSPVAAYLYRMMGSQGIYESLNYSTAPMNEDSSKLLLESLPRDAVATIAHNAAAIADTRADDLFKMVEELN